MLILWVGLTLCCTLICGREDVKENKFAGVQVREPQTLTKNRRQAEEVDAEMLDKLTEVVEDEKTKSKKKKKTPEEIEAGM